MQPITVKNPCHFSSKELCERIERYDGSVKRALRGLRHPTDGVEPYIYYSILDKQKGSYKLEPPPGKPYTKKQLLIMVDNAIERVNIESRSFHLEMTRRMINAAVPDLPATTPESEEGRTPRVEDTVSISRT